MFKIKIKIKTAQHVAHLQRSLSLSLQNMYIIQSSSLTVKCMEFEKHDAGNTFLEKIVYRRENHLSLCEPFKV